jgi:hypothetical protein
MKLTREQKEKVILDYLCYDQIGERVYGEDSNDNSTEIQWVPVQEAWQIIKTYDGIINIEYESNGCERAIDRLDDEILDYMIEDLYSDEDLEEMFKQEDEEAAE